MTDSNTPGPRRRPRLSVVAGLAMVLALLGAVLSTTPAGAATSSFATQTRAAGLSTSQAASLQREINGYIARTGGHQVSANKVEFAGGYVIAAAPGQKYARDLSLAPNAALAYGSCSYGDFCAYSGENGTGGVAAYYKCQSVSPPFSSTGSWWNNQTTGTKTYFYRYRGAVGGPVILYYTSTASQKYAVWNWATTVSMTTC